ncbi:MAG: tetratricopeptide repeat protein [Proteobacteria bacterium]|nr:tetratricopeptide repeat protein [Pseudomonadota bacterium]
MASVWKELKRRNVLRVAVAYAIVSWLILQIADVLTPLLRLPEWVGGFVFLLLVIGFLLALILSWAYELTPEGLKKEKDVERSESITHVTGRKLDFAIIAMLVVALGYFSYDKFVLDPGRDAAEVEAAVQVASAVERQDSAKTIAVLPFVNMSDDASNEYFSDGISEEILNLLSKVSELRVTSRSSAFSFKGQNLDVPTMAARLNVAHILEGSVRKSGNDLRITAQLIDVATDTHLWSETYDRELENIFAIQDEIAAAVVDALKITLLGTKPKATETNPEAYALYLQGRHLINQRTEESNKQAETLLKQALDIDSGFAPAWAALGSVYRRQAAFFGLRPVDEGYEMARHAIQKALEIDAQLGLAYGLLAAINMSYDWDFDAAVQNVQRALKLNPRNATILMTAGRLNDALGRVDEAIDLYRQSIALDPVSPEGHNRLGGIFYNAHRLEEAADSFQMAQSLMPGRHAAQFNIGLVLLAQGDAPAALVAMEQETSDAIRLFGTAVVQHALGDAGASDAALQELIEKWAATSAYHVAHAYAFRGEIDNAFDWLEQAYDNHDSGLTEMLLHSLLANLHDDPRWEPFLDKMGLPH